MPNISAELPTLKSEWLQPETVLKYLRYFPTFIATISTLKKSFPKRGGSKRDLKQLGAEIDDLRKDFETLCEVLLKASKSHQKLVEAGARFVSTCDKLIPWIPVAKRVLEVSNQHTTIVLGHERRIKVLETALAIKAKRGKPTPALTGAKPQKKRRAKRGK